MCTFTYTTPTFTTEVFHHVSTATFNECYSELMAYTALAFSYWISFHEAYQCKGYAN